jgi:hypothetical protein
LLLSVFTTKFEETNVLLFEKTRFYTHSNTRLLFDPTSLLTLQERWWKLCIFSLSIVANPGNLFVEHDVSEVANIIYGTSG